MQSAPNSQNTGEATAESSETAPEPSSTFTVRNDSIHEQIVGRADAIRRAKKLSADGDPIFIERLDGVVHMEFRQGALLKYGWHPPRR